MSLDVPHKNNAVEIAWKLLEKLVHENEMRKSTVLRKCVATKLIGIGEYLPHWLYTSYKQSNPSELLNLYVMHARLIEATKLAIEYILAMIGTGGEYFGLANSLHSTFPALCFPVNAIDLLIYGLEMNSKQDAEYEDSLRDLKQVIVCYRETVDRVSTNKIQYHMSSVC